MNRVTIPEFMLMVDVNYEREEYEDYNRHAIAYLTMCAKSIKRVGKKKSELRYPTFKSFYDREEQLAIYKGHDPKKKKSSLLEKVKAFHAKKERGV